MKTKEYGRKMRETTEFESGVRRVVDGDITTYEYPAGDFTYRIEVDVAQIAQNSELDVAPWLTVLPDLLSNPYEIWMTFEKHKGSGKVALRYKIIKAYNDGKSHGKGIVLLANAQNGKMVTEAFFKVDSIDDLNQYRVGKLIFAMDK